MRSEASFSISALVFKGEGQKKKKKGGTSENLNKFISHQKLLHISELLLFGRIPAKFHSGKNSEFEQTDCRQTDFAPHSTSLTVRLRAFSPSVSFRLCIHQDAGKDNFTAITAMRPGRRRSFLLVLSLALVYFLVKTTNSPPPPCDRCAFHPAQPLI